MAVELVAIEVVDVVDNVGVAEGVEESGTGMIGWRSDGRVAGSGWAGCVVVFNDGSKASGSIASGLMGQMPVFANAEMTVDFLNAAVRAV